MSVDGYGMKGPNPSLRPLSQQLLLSGSPSSVVEQFLVRGAVMSSILMGSCQHILFFVGVTLRDCSQKIRTFKVGDAALK